MLLPTMDEVAMILKMKYNQAVSKIDPEKLIYFENSPDYCKANPKYNITGITGRECTKNDNHISHSRHCSNLCCDHGYEKFQKKVPKPCNCRFVWCCKVECDTCHVYETRHRCKSMN